MIGRRIGRFRVLAKLGEGGMATVWKAHDELLDRTVAVKVLAESLADSPEAKKRFRHEAEVAARLTHPGIAEIIASGDADGVTYLAMSYIDGETLSQRIAARLLPIREAVEIVAVAGTAIAHAHGQGVVHRDVTSRNIMIAGDGRVFVLDFGLALASGISRVTSGGTTLGTLAYMAPEVMEGTSADERSDIYGLGIVFYEALTGALPFSVEMPEALYYAALHKVPRPPCEHRPEIPPALQGIVLKAIARDPRNRYQRMDDLLAALRSVEGPPADGAVVGRAPSVARLLAKDVPLHLAVLPMGLEGDDPDGEATRVAAGLTSSLERSLAEVGRVHVVPMSGPAPNGTTVGELRACGRRIGAQAFLQGTLRRAGSQLRASLSILDSESGVRIAGGAANGSLTEGFDFEDRVISSVRRTLGDRSGGRQDERPHASDPAAPERYAQAMGYLKRHDSEGSVDGAIRLLERLAERDPGSATSLAGLARAYLRKQAIVPERIWESRAAEACERANVIAPDSPEVLQALGELQLNVGRYDEACATFARARQAGGDAFDAWLGTGIAHGRVGRFEDAEHACREAVRLQPNDWRGHSALGWVLFQRGDFEGALEPWRRVVELTPDNAKGRRNLGSALYRLDRFEEAVAAYRESLAIQPHQEAFSNLGTALYFLGHYEDAIAALRKATELVPSDPIRWGNLGNAYIRLANTGGGALYEVEAHRALDKSIALMRERLDRNPTVALSWAFMAGWLANRGREREAREAVEQTLLLGSEDPQCLAEAGRVYFYLGDRRECLRWLREAVRHGYGVGELERSRVLAPLRDTPEFRMLLEEGRSGTAKGTHHG